MTKKGGRRMEEKLKNLELKYTCLKFIGEDYLNEKGILMLRVLERIFEEEKTSSKENEISLVVSNIESKSEVAITKDNIRIKSDKIIIVD